MNRFHFWNRTSKPKRAIPVRTRRLLMENLENRILLAVMAGAFTTSAETVFTAPPNVAGETVEIRVTNLNDSGAGSFRDALTSAAAGDTILFDGSLSAKTLTVRSALPEIDRSITIEGNGVKLTPRIGYTGAALGVTGGTVHLSGLTFTGFKGGALTVSDADVTITDSVFTKNYSARVIGNDHQQIAGGAVNGYNTNLTIVGCSFSGNSGSGYGGTVAVYNETEAMFGNVLSVKDSVFTNNLATGTLGRGGGIMILGGILHLNGCEFVGNRAEGGAGQGGAVYVQPSASAQIDGCLFQWNYAETEGGAIFFHVQIDASISNSLIVNNAAGKFGGGIRTTYESSSLILRNCTVAFNCSQDAYGNGVSIGYSQDVLVYNSILANGFCGDETVPNANFYRTQNTLITSDNSSNEIGFAQVHFTDPESGLEYNFANWETADWRALDWDYSISPESPAFDAGANEDALIADGSAPIPFDITGAKRFVHQVDIGAMECQTYPERQLDIPARVALTAAGAKEKKVTWDAVENALSYTVSYSEDRIHWKEIETTETAVTLTGLNNDYRVSVRVRAVGDLTAFRKSDYSEPVTQYVCPMDTDGDGVIGPSDQTVISDAWLSSTGEEKWDPRADIDGDGMIGPADRSFLSDNWMRSAAERNLRLPKADPHLFPSLDIPNGAEFLEYRHQTLCEKMTALGEKIDVLMIGDSITHLWTWDLPNDPDNEPVRGDLVWSKYFDEPAILNFGFSGGTTHSLLARLNTAPLSAISPRVVVILIGVNNVRSGESAETVVNGILAIQDRVRNAFPGVKILQLAIFPHGEYPNHPKRIVINQANALLNERVRDMEDVTWLDIGPLLLHEDGTIPSEIMPDFLHVNPKGFEIWGQTMKPILDELRAE